ncbi:TVP38/TMEM64 family protein [Mycolicibacillus trivialis]|uniref:TVP38/TMEM64 family membrane protein n=1 Tax=Mycolicibacillus trivialis TaxID=1798 RepID=A0A1X2EPI2_9MYCO|nr:TVP38/TMEM64 family protein [Mycolicibacillus trivialis]ORX08024.1 hypothetical protein AWC30_03680 [Mycolicibacillus trivialis]
MAGPVRGGGYRGPVRTTQLRALRSTLLATVRALPRGRVAVLLAGIALLVAAAWWLLPVPTAVQLRDWVAAAGPWVPAVFLVTHTLVTVAPFPRTVFTLAAGLLFGAWLGVALAVTASTLSALLTLLLVRATGWRMDRLVSHPRLTAVDARLRERGWTAVLALRLIPAVPFSVINYAAGASAIRVRPYTVATVAGLAPGTAALVLFGDAFTGRINPALALTSAAIAAVGVGLLVVEATRHRWERVG